MSLTSMCAGLTPGFFADLLLAVATGYGVATFVEWRDRREYRLWDIAATAVLVLIGIVFRLIGG